MNRLVLVVLVLLVAAGGLWLASQGKRDGRALAPEPATGSPPAPPHQASPESKLVPAVTPAAAERTSLPRPEESSVPAGGFPVEHQSFALADARWIEVVVVFPPGLPREDEPALIAFAPLAGDDDQAPSAVQLGEQLGLDDSFVEDLDDGCHWARRPLAERLRMPFPAEARTAIFFVQSRYLHLDPLEVELATTKSLTLEPELGGYVTGRCTFPPERKAEFGAIELEFDGRQREDGLMGFARPDSRDVRVRADLCFELRALSASKKYVVQARAQGFVGHFELSFEIAPGQHRELEIPFRLGAVLSGVVRGEGRPLAGARVSAKVRGNLPWDDGLSVESGADGVFRLEGVPAGRVTLKAEMDGWLEAEAEPLEVVEGREAGGIELELGAGLRIEGTVLWPDGRAVEGAKVQALKANQRWMQTLTETRSDAGGRFLLGGLEAGSVEVFAGSPPADPTVAAGEPTEHDEQSAGRWMARSSAVAPGTSGLVLTLQAPLPVVGTVVDDTGAPVPAFRVEARRAAGLPGNSPEEVSRTFASPDGAFALEVGLPGDWLFSARATEGEQRGEAVPLTLPQSLPLRLVLARTSSIAGMVVDPAGLPIEGAEVHVSRDPGQTAMGFFGDGECTSDADGRFTLASVQSGSSVHASHADWAPSERHALELLPGEARTDLVLRLRVGARITGEVFDAAGEPEAAKNVNCSSSAMAAMAFGFGGERSGVTDAAGRFAFEHVSPGKITVSAVPSEEELMQKFQEGADEAAFLSMLSDMRTATVEVADGGEAHVVLGARPKQPVRVHGLVTEAGRPLAGTQVFAFAEGGALFQGMKLARTDADGRYELLLDRPGDFVFGVSLAEDMEGTGAPFYVEVPEVAELEQDLALPLGRIAGVVLGPDGPAAGVPLRLVSAEGLIGLDDLSESHRASTSLEGLFQFEHLRPGAYALHVGSEFDGGASEPRFGQLVVDGIELEPDRAVEGLVVHLRAPGKLAGLVRDAAGNPLGGLAVFVRDAAGRAISASACISDAAGRFTYSGIAPGHVTASAKSAKHVTPESAPVEIRPGETSQLELTAAPGTFLRVALLEGDTEVRARLRVLDEAGRRVDDLFGMQDFAALLSEGFSSRERRIGPLAPGKYTLIATALDGKDAKKSLLVEAGQEERSVKLRLK